MKRYILTGTPGCGKTSILLALEMKGYFVISEAATDINAYEHAMGNPAPWKNPDFIDQIIHLQKKRQMQVSQVHSDPQFYDRSPFCTYALAIWLNVKPSSTLLQEIDRIEKNRIYEKKVFFVENLGFCKPTEIRKIGFEDSLRFEELHLQTYTQFGFECIKIPQAPLIDRVETILKSLNKTLRKTDAA